MATRERPVDRGDAAGRRLVDELGREVRLARAGHGLSLGAVAVAAGLSVSEVSRIERGHVPRVPLLVLARLLAVVGSELSARAFPVESPLRDAAHVRLLGRLRDRIHAELELATEVPLPMPGDRRAWDAMIRGPDWLLPVEAETRVRDRQALERRVALKLRDSLLSACLLVLADTRSNRAVVRADPAWRTAYPVAPSVALERLARGEHPGGSAIILL